MTEAWGAGGQIPHVDNLDDATAEHLYYNTYVSGGVTYGFGPSRHGIFHYLIMAHRNDAGSDSVLGWGYAPGDWFVLFDDNLGGTWPWTDRGTMQAHVFMHELGYNLMGVYYPNPTDAANNPHSHNPNAAHLINVDPPNNDNEHCGPTCALQTNLYPWDTHAIDYCSDCWNAIDLAWGFWWTDRW